ncbi:uncharacterized MFS-type transporter C09D4.1-like [Schistocerca cancellata]|uniref:uncharacterized MFS-type transporter C09D4.1-like n=1 Tax=Schistocerca cancellata TaxID=274614 RepID=UPI002118BCB1|nr:uncharacterized MFS-type transporter C09D4.1-like [Schistocerca cancellata]
MSARKMSIRADYAAVALQDPAQSPLPLRVRVYPRRWLILAIYMLFSTSNLWQWIQYAIVGNLVRKYYDVSSYAVDWTSVLFMLVYIPFVYPASSLINEKGLRLSILLGAALNAAATWLKVLAVAPGRFWLLLVAQSIAAVAQVFVLTVPPTVAFLWFGANEVSTACALGVFGNQLGVSLSFFLTPLLITDHENVEDIGWDMKVYSYSLAGGSTLVLLLVIAFFQDKPATPPSVAVAVREMSASKQGEAGGGSSLGVLRRLLRCPPFLLLVASLSLCFIVFNAVGTMLNPLILLYFPNGEAFAGRVGLLFVVSGTAGGLVCGFILDKTHKFKHTSVVLVVILLVSMVAFTFTLSLGNHAVVYVVSLCLGFSSGGYFPVGMEFVSELTYPEPESIAMAVMMIAVQAASSAATVLYGWMLGAVGDLWANVFLSALLLVALLVTVFIREDLRRHHVSLAANAPDRKDTEDARKNSFRVDGHH